ncbi:hypothetical protein KIW84_012982 [Lathyrus oleraceus]|uniref:Uncharacterized protein n=1 Tax=Pisum sativum TaxID=3888 RepID=A0A9D5BJ44_PEA|nr:hypothetical protein KIW84_012982 [Pisum sativum]
MRCYDAMRDLRVKIGVLQYPEDRFKVSRLEGFVSNREQSYEDPIEELLYAVFVVSNENASVAELATTLQANLSQLQAATSFVCRLGWATKVIDPSSILQDTSMPGSSRSTVTDEDASLASHGFDNIHIDNDIQRDALGSSNHGPRSAYMRVAFIVDANITSYLMMGSVSPGRKSHADTLHEADKLGHASISDLCKDLSTPEGAKFEGELQEFTNHAFNLRCVLECLQSGEVASDVKVEEGHDKMNMATPINAQQQQDQETEEIQHGPLPVEQLQTSGIVTIDVKKLEDAGICAVESVAYTPRKEQFKSSSRKSESAYHVVTDVAILRFMVEVCWGSMLAAFSVTLDQNDDRVVTSQSLQGFRHAVDITAVMGMQTQRDAFVTSVAKFTYLHCAGDMKQKNVDAVKAIISIAIEDGEGAPSDATFFTSSNFETEERTPKTLAFSSFKKGTLQNPTMVAIVRGSPCDSTSVRGKPSTLVTPE